MQFNLFANQVTSLAALPLPDADVLYQAGWLSAVESNQLAAQLQKELPWRQDSIKLYGREVKIPRLQSWHGAPHCHYQYSNLSLTPQRMTASLSHIQQRLQRELACQFNCVLANWYRDGQDGMGMHADDEPELGAQPVIASLSLGAARKFSFKHLASGKRTDFILEPGSLLVMRGATQQHYHHGLAKTRKPVSDRINLTYRYIIDPGANQ
ncbi:alpha-ketoglutarate-dependent dioxygenase AlkB family protein [Alteromonas gilva]|uniref:Alpha-ketoglutarate-dependent dioxygenase AlkB n=1 Tax=Alteromonas gilva TaxID=2987522 RepID=A0ABT5L8U3_9ALTE|nr:alpha-ketoglutarate-dependent dioxygenase AlkB [Alteromonas gilva]MDC8832402.1 alpha-ketoglutarate-dependent dioxygenase AlkB [Alteromonas gilva]